MHRTTWRQPQKEEKEEEKEKEEEEEEENSSELIIFIQPTRWEYKSVQQRKRKDGEGPKKSRGMAEQEAFLVSLFINPVDQWRHPATLTFKWKRHWKSPVNELPEDGTRRADVWWRRASPASFNWLCYFISYSCCVAKLFHVILHTHRHTHTHRRRDTRRRRRRSKLDRTTSSMKLSSASVDNRYLAAGCAFSVELVYFIVSLNRQTDGRRARRRKRQRRKRWGGEKRRKRARRRRKFIKSNRVSWKIETIVGTFGRFCILQSNSKHLKCPSLNQNSWMHSIKWYNSNNNNNKDNGKIKIILYSLWNDFSETLT